MRTGMAPTDTHFAPHGQYEHTFRDAKTEKGEEGGGGQEQQQKTPLLACLRTNSPHTKKKNAETPSHPCGITTPFFSCVVSLLRCVGVCVAWPLLGVQTQRKNEREKRGSARANQDERGKKEGKRTTNSKERKQKDTHKHAQRSAAVSWVH